MQHHRIGEFNPLRSEDLPQQVVTSVKNSISANGYTTIENPVFDLTYTIGLNHHNTCELMVRGPTGSHAVQLISAVLHELCTVDAASMLQGGTFSISNHPQIPSDLRLRLRPVDEPLTRFFCQLIHPILGDDFRIPVMQIEFADQKGVMPDDESCDPAIRNMQDLELVFMHNQGLTIH